MKLNLNAKILNGYYTNWYFRIEDDTKITGGYYLLLFDTLEPGVGNGFDNWFLTIEEVEKHIAHYGWIFEWID
ncbi:MAG: hypothetical protein FWF76_02675 [Oscillospiraceae bacterium]|nr:hypothetical protein [Oscillospiraceae bacterium]